MSLALWLCAALAAPAPAAARPCSAHLLAFDNDGRPLDASALAAFIGRGDGAIPALWGLAPDGTILSRPKLSQDKQGIALSWDGPPRLILSLPWPLPAEGFSTLLVDRGGRGIADGETIRLNEELALTQYRLFKEARLRHEASGCKPGRQALRLAQAARDAVARADAGENPPERARLFGRSLSATSQAWRALQVDCGRQRARSKAGGALRLGLTLDGSMVDRIRQYRWIVKEVRRSGANWARLVFRLNPGDFAYERQASFNEYDAIVRALDDSGLRVMGCVLDSTQWPAGLTPELYSRRALDLVRHYKGRIGSWELGSELNGDWLGGRGQALPARRVYDIVSAASAQVKELDPKIEVVDTLYWWEGASPDAEHSLQGWLANYVPLGFGKNVDVVALSLWPRDSPVGMSLERAFAILARALPGKPLMLGSLGYSDGPAPGYWWGDAESAPARADLLAWLTPASCGLERCLGGVFWSQALEQMLPDSGRPTPLYRAWRKAVRDLR
ncbi:MAG: hypothetical protein KGO96_07960 [Elusimicrobia bacterium]|nr:hypothetical protein [Elusimicrobiota bacterium]MDE2236535.1 hypothetical protein [Elusimicrobiota bacterium]MDE2425825.1 hypothetical protein [Elusimicrobiota bacterium]